MHTSNKYLPKKKTFMPLYSVLKQLLKLQIGRILKSCMTLTSFCILHTSIHTHIYTCIHPPFLWHLFSARVFVSMSSRYQLFCCTFWLNVVNGELTSVSFVAFLWLSQSCFRYLMEWTGYLQNIWLKIGCCVWVECCFCHLTESIVPGTKERLFLLKIMYSDWKMVSLYRPKLSEWENLL